MFTPRGLVNNRAVTFQGFLGIPTNLTGLAAEGMRQSMEKIREGGIAGLLLAFVKIFCCILCDNHLEVSETPETECV
jgi:hypothetical protein